MYPPLVYKGFFPSLLDFELGTAAGRILLTAVRFAHPTSTQRAGHIAGCSSGSAMSRSSRAARAAGTKAAASTKSMPKPTLPASSPG